MSWTEIDLGKGEWIIPKERTKNGKEHLVHLSPDALSDPDVLEKGALQRCLCLHDERHNSNLADTPRLSASSMTCVHWRLKRISRNFCRRLSSRNGECTTSGAQRRQEWQS